jgi:hypothetical protein
LASSESELSHDRHNSAKRAIAAFFIKGFLVETAVIYYLL